MPDLNMGRWRKDAWDRDLGMCPICNAGLRQPCISSTGYTRSPHEMRITDPALAILHVAAGR